MTNRTLPLRGGVCDEDHMKNANSGIASTQRKAREILPTYPIFDQDEQIQDLQYIWNSVFVKKTLFNKFISSLSVLVSK